MRFGRCIFINERSRYMYKLVIDKFRKISKNQNTYLMYFNQVSTAVKISRNQDPCLRRSDERQHYWIFNIVKGNVN